MLLPSAAAGSPLHSVAAADAVAQAEAYRRRRSPGGRGAGRQEAPPVWLGRPRPRARGRQALMQMREGGAVGSAVATALSHVAKWAGGQPIALSLPLAVAAGVAAAGAALVVNEGRRQGYGGTGIALVAVQGVVFQPRVAGLAGGVTLALCLGYEAIAAPGPAGE